MYKYLKIASIFALICSVSSNFAYAAPKNLRFQASGKWNIENANEKCSIARAFGEGDDKINLFITQFAPSDTFDMLISGKPIKAPRSKRNIIVQFGEFEKKQKLEFFNATSRDGTPSIIIKSEIRIAPSIDPEQEALSSENSIADNGIDPTSAAREEAVTYILVQPKYNKNVILETGSLKAPFDTLRKCAQTLLTDWGLDPDQNETKISAPIPLSNPLNWILPSDYPQEQLLNGAQSIVRFRLNVDDKGEATDCTIQESFGDKEFDKAVCKALIRNAKFTPAKDQHNKPMASYWNEKVIFATAL